MEGRNKRKLDFVAYLQVLYESHLAQFQFSSVAQSCLTLCNPMNHSTPGLPVHKPPCPSPTPGFHSDSRPSSQWCHPAISSSVVPFSSCPQSLIASVFSNESTLRMRWPKYWSFSFSIILSTEHPGLISFIEWTRWIFLQSKGLSRVFSNTTVQKHQFFGAQLSSQSNSRIHTWPLEKP